MLEDTTHVRKDKPKFSLQFDNLSACSTKRKGMGLSSLKDTEFA
jgi:hypothetical protein